jgi:WD40 repeat protein
LKQTGEAMHIAKLVLLEAFTAVMAQSPNPVQTNPAILKGHVGEVLCVRFSQDEQTIATGDGRWNEAGVIRLWDLSTHRTRATLAGHHLGITALAFSPDGKLLASGSYDHRILLWDMRTGQQHGILGSHESWVSAVCFSPDSTTLVSGDQAGFIKLWDIRTQRQRRAIKGHGMAITSLAFAPEGSRIASGSLDSDVKLWGFPDLKESLVLHQRGGVCGVAFAPDSKRLAVGVTGDFSSLKESQHRTWNSIEKAVADGGALVLWDVSPIQEKGHLKVKSGGVSTVSFFPDGKRVAFGTCRCFPHQEEPGEVRIWNTATGDTFTSPEKQLQGVTCVSVSSSGTLLASGGNGTAVFIWDPRSFPRDRNK